MTHALDLTPNAGVQPAPSAEGGEGTFGPGAERPPRSSRNARQGARLEPLVGRQRDPAGCEPMLSRCILEELWRVISDDLP